MASNNHRPPVTSTSRSGGQGRKKNNDSNNKITEDQQQMVLNIVTEMFESTLEYDVIISIAENCNWDLQSTIDALIALSATVENKCKPSIDVCSPISQLNKQRSYSIPNTPPNDFIRIDKSELKQQLEGLTKFEQLKMNFPKNRMDSFQGNLSKLGVSLNKTSTDSPADKVSSNMPWNTVIGSKKKDEKKIGYNNQNPNFASQNVYAKTKQYKPMNDNSSSYFSDGTSNLRKHSEMSNPFRLSNVHNDTKFCGLKVHYRQSGTESSSEDDDADVVVEEELNDFNSQSTIPINVSQLLSSSSSSSSSFVQSSPKNIQTKKLETKCVKSPSKSQKKTVGKEDQLESIKFAIQNNAKIMILLRGLPGSGKSKFAEDLIASTIGKNPHLHIFSADDYFTSQKGIYTWDPTKTGEAHSMNQYKVMQAMKEGRTPIIVANTNLQIWEMKPYAAMAVKYCYTIEIIEIDTPWALKVNELAKKNCHGVHKKKIKEMLERYERGINGEKLLEIFSLKYPKNMMPKRINRRPFIANIKSNNDDVLSSADMEVLQQIENLPSMMKSEDEHLENNSKNFKNDKDMFKDYMKTFGKSDTLKAENITPEMSNQKSKSNNNNLASNSDDIHLLQPLGAIGCERKNSLVNLDVINLCNEVEILNKDGEENALSKCWDFTLCLDGQILHSDHNNDSYQCKKPSGSPINAEEMRKQDEEFGKENNSGSSSENNDDESIETDNDDDKESSLNDEKNQMDEFFRKLTAEYNKSGSNFEVKQSTVVITEIFDEDNNKQDENDKKEAELSECEDAIIAEEIMDDNHVMKNDGTNETIIDGDIEIISSDNDEKLNDVNVQSDSKYSVIKEKIEELIADGSILEKTIRIDNKKLNNIEDPQKLASKSTLGSLFHIIKTSILGDGKSEDQEKKLSQNVVDKEIPSTSNKNEANDNFGNNQQLISELPSVKTKITTPKRNLVNNQLSEPEICSDNEEDKKVDNINRITWKQSPFPLDDISDLNLNFDEEENMENELVSVVDNSTNTSYYDFNVAYIGGTIESGYRTIDAFDRSINNALYEPKVERPPKKLMLEKSSMTDNLLNKDDNLLLDDENQGLSNLMDLFPHIPKDYLIEIYENLCQKNLPWAVEVLLDGVPDNVMLKIPQESEVVDNSASSSAVVTSNNTAEPLDNVVHHEFHPVRIPEPVLKPYNHDLKLHRLRSTPPVLRPDLAKDEKSPEKSPEPEEIIEINLGFDIIHQLEEQFGNPDFHVPDGFQPIVHMKKSMAEELYALWIESMYHQLNARHEQLDQMLAKDAELAEKLERELEEGANEWENPSEPPVPNLNEIMDMELALAKYKKQVKVMLEKELPNDMASMLSRQMLHESHPDIDPETLNAILKAHNGNFKATFDTISFSTGKLITPCGSPKKHENIINEFEKENENIEIIQESRSSTPIIVVKKENKTEKSLYKDVLLNATDSRNEAQRHFSLRIENLNKADEAYRRGYPAVAAYYSQIARIHGNNSKTAHADAADALIHAQTFSNKQNILDLHYLFVSEALRALDEFLEYHQSQLTKSNKKSIVVYIITGKGLRSNNGTSKIKPAVSKRLLNRSIRFSETNPGCLKVILYRKSGID